MGRLRFRKPDNRSTLSSASGHRGEALASTCTTLNIAVLAPIPGASVGTATAKNPGDLMTVRPKYPMSCARPRGGDRVANPQEKRNFAEIGLVEHARKAPRGRNRGGMKEDGKNRGPVIASYPTEVARTGTSSP